MLPQAGLPADCSPAEISRQVEAINIECCDEPGEDCSGGNVHTCTAGCGALILPLWTACQAQLGRDVTKTLRDAVALCPPAAAAAPSPPPTGAVAVQEFRRVSTTANLATCVPACSAVTHGFLLSIEVDGKGTVSRAAATPLSAPLLLRQGKAVLQHISGN